MRRVSDATFGLNERISTQTESEILHLIETRPKQNHFNSSSYCLILIINVDFRERCTVAGDITGGDDGTLFDEQMNVIAAAADTVQRNQIIIKSHWNR